MITWVRHEWSLEGACCGGAAEAYVENGSLADAHLARHFESTREVGVEYPRACEADRLMKGWIRFG